MATVHDTITLTTSGTAYEILPVREGNGRDVTIQNNNASAIVYIGGTGVTTSDYGFKILPNAAISFELDGTDNIWAVSGTNAATVNTMSIKLEGSYRV
jgi:molybdopterin biosynthesis enzyme MoaB